MAGATGHPAVTLPSPTIPLGAPIQIGTPTAPVARVPGEITIADEVMEKIVSLAAGQVPGVAGLPAGGVTTRLGDGDLTVDLTLAVEYNTVIMEVAQSVRDSVGRVAGRMLGLRVRAVNVTVGDVWLPDAPAA